MTEEKKDSPDPVDIPRVDESIAEKSLAANVDEASNNDEGASSVGEMSKDNHNDTAPSTQTQKNTITNDNTKSGNRKNAIDDTVIPQSNINELPGIDRASRHQNAIDSDKDYRRITEKIIDKTCLQLTQHTKAKEPLRKQLSWFIIIILSVQFVVLVAIMFLNRVWDLRISDFILNVYIVSVFVETLAGLIIMINFAFNSKQEVELISILNAIIINFKKYDDK